MKFEDSFTEMSKLINKSFLSKEMKEKYIALLDERKKCDLVKNNGTRI